MKNEIGHPLFAVKATTYADGEIYVETYVIAADSLAELGEIMDKYFDMEEMVSYTVTAYENVVAVRDFEEDEND